MHLEDTIVHPLPGNTSATPDPDAVHQTYAYPRGVELFRQGDVLPEVLQIVSGIVKLAQSDVMGNESITAVRFDGDWLGTAAVVAGEPSPVSARTCSDAVLRRVPSATFRALLLDDTELSMRIHEAHSRDLCWQTTWLGHMCSMGSIQRLQCLLCRIASFRSVRTSGTGVKMQLPLHHWELAEFIGVRPEYLSRLLREMEAEDLIRRDKGWIIIPDPARLCDPRSGSDEPHGSVTSVRD
jgi:CRP-like cAMP-binding protein